MVTNSTALCHGHRPPNGSDNADFVKAWQHIASLIHSEGTKDGITAKTLWNPATTNGSSYDVQTLYPGDQYADVISVDIYGGGTPNNLVDFATGGTTVDSSYAVWAAKPANIQHYYLYENFTLGNLTPGLGATGASGFGWSVADTIAFAKLITSRSASMKPVRRQARTMPSFRRGSPPPSRG